MELMELIFSAFILVETNRKTQYLFLWTKSRFRNGSHYVFGKMCVACVTLSHPCLVKKIIKMLLSNWRVTLFRGTDFLHALNPGYQADSPATLSEYMQFMRVLENITSCSLFSNCLRPFRNFSHHTLTSNKHPFLFSLKTCNVVPVSGCRYL